MMIALSRLRLPGLNTRRNRITSAPAPPPVISPEDAAADRAGIDTCLRLDCEMDRGQLEMMMLAEPILPGD